MRIFAIFALLYLSVDAYSQLRQTFRYEVEVKPTENSFTIISADSLGLYLLQDTDKYEKREKKWRLIFLDKELKQQSDQEILINDRYVWIGHEVHGNFLYLLFRTSDYNKSDLYLVKVKISDGSVQTFDIENELDFEITHFSVCDKSILMGGYINFRPALILFDFINDQNKIVPGFYMKNSKLIDITVNVNNTFNVLILNQKNNKDESLDIKIYDSQGNVLAEDLFYIPEEKKIVSGLTSRLKNESLIVTGAFRNAKSKLAEGLFWGKVDLSKKQSLKLIPIGTFSSLYNYFPDKRQAKLKERAKRKMKENRFFEKEFISLNGLVEWNRHFYLSFEIFDPYSLKSNQMATPYNASPYFDAYRFSRYYSPIPNTYGPEEFNRVKYQQAIVATFNDSGTLLWDSAMVFSEVKTDILEQISDFTVSTAGISIAYKKDDNVHWQYIDPNTQQAMDSTASIMLEDSYTELKREFEGEGGVRRWYNGSFYIWGYQRVHELDEDENKHYFYINKLETKG